ncbi:lysine--tRNA ligase [Candidatus Uhrbacteria bacterium CG_4_9_14_3_um_filter_50_9]|uniref:Lysine--tRNA ligase n=1 Tax=Candidatus Uhrbacteria bacterium CG_4_9_14_3_um_filter_50_9 TaxID=1975035 RepID=A0A2M7XDT7_9BACT|nr:MAG: lysine--tRNA ligase [Candidatus Uhrbacteria bacterium CG_4_9_14_3_um_filter_50_9]
MTQEEQDRLNRLAAIRETGVDPYPSKTSRTHEVRAFLSDFNRLESSGDRVTLVGRIRLLRKHGGLTFLQLQDASGTSQLALKRDEVGEDVYSQFHATVDVADFLEVHGTAFATKKGEPTLNIQAYKMLTKSTLPLPEKWHGVSDIETRFRKRYLDLIMNEDVRERMMKRTRIISAIRELLDVKGFMEVETPTLQPIYGGGFAKPFVTHHNALDADFFLRISDEMYLKRLLVGGFEKVYEITKVFRNEGIDRDHNPEFTMFEAQVAYENVDYGMDLFEEIFEYAAQKALGTTHVQHEEVLIELQRPWKRMRLIDSVAEIGGLPTETWGELEPARAVLKEKLSKKAQEEVGRITSVGELLAFAFEELVEEKLIQPTIIYDYPVEVSPLAKRASDKRFVERFEAFALGSEIGNNYSELNDPVDLEQRFIEEKDREKAGFDEAHQTDFAYLEAIKHGMPPACGLGIGIDRMIMLLTGAKNIKEVILFPTLRPEQEE